MPGFVTELKGEVEAVMKEAKGIADEIRTLVEAKL